MYHSTNLEGDGTAAIHIVHIALALGTPLQRLRQEFLCSLGEVAKSLQVAEAELPEGKDTEGITMLPKLMCTHHQHTADYIKLLMEHGQSLTLGEDWATPLIMEVCSCYFLSPVFSLIFTDLYAFIMHLIIFDIHLSVGTTKNAWPIISGGWQICFIQMPSNR